MNCLLHCCNVLHRNVNKINDGIWNTGDTVQSMSTAIIGTVSAFYFGWKLTLINLVLVPFFLVGAYFFNKVFLFPP